MEFEDNFNLSFINERMMHSNYFNKDNNINNGRPIHQQPNRYHPYQLVKPQAIQYLQIPINNQNNNTIYINNNNTNNHNNLNSSGNNNIYSSSSPIFSPMSPYQSSPYSSPFPSPKGAVPPQLFLCSTPNANHNLERSSSSPATIVSPPPIQIENKSNSNVENSNNNNNNNNSNNSNSNSNNSNSKGFYGMTSKLLQLCQSIDGERGVSKEKTRMLTELHDELDLIIKKINKVKKNKLPYPPLPSDDPNKSFIDLRPRRNRKCKLTHKENEDNIQCQRCGTKDTPEWRKGPDGCKSLCNACGLYYAKTKKREQEQSYQTSSSPLQQSEQETQFFKEQQNQQQSPQQQQKSNLNSSVSNTSIISISSLINN
ncbi:GATA-binding transcription factor [Heterostelium album PN500]|uniref:GATA-binding transcription factor n=1 Tax=Heterostelium pallidum (strain ATCC 26659 / Pp 5 / PN500) TaxID=670386 RepID=D3BH45_HETP5|nr:GATA-binding transcription factor [Heterostelium album PN500]EFA79429.1 GATA-binding transcription factor [Heterostelium album PN500]|eukprot:XP_020431550.1 GATA-binding transcription factor [Heterostelium album PN500]